MPERIPAAATIRVPLQAYLASDHVTPATGAMIVVMISKNGASYANPSAGTTNATEIGSGSYYVDLSTTDTGTAGPLYVKGTSATIDNIISIYNIVNANNAGFAGVPNAVANANGGLPILSSSGTALAYTVSTVTTYTGNTPQTGDSFARIGATGSGLTSITAKTDNLPSDPADESLIIAATDAIMSRIGVAGVGLTNLGDTRIANLNATVSSRSAPGTAQTIDLTTLVPLVNVTTDTTLTVGNALLAACVQAAGAWALVGTTLTLKNPDGSTFRTFTLDSSTAPTSRT